MNATQQYVAIAKRNGLRPGRSKGNRCVLASGATEYKVGVAMAATGSCTIYYECYRAEAMADDDSSFTGNSLDERPGCTRIRGEWPADSTRIPAHVIAAIEAVIGSPAASAPKA